ncbi:hypothetical protein AVEN_135659-1 [Araneus ventricosus]|uniref:Uncharacterized protein n=1 Tax=Araneus ventricosus TaxID=182803 RepID=A0A4Y2EI56_ARAVE|nr:hypothetical protein AVEN_135659-1 [Araneus ventricosus]
MQALVVEYLCRQMQKVWISSYSGDTFPFITTNTFAPMRTTGGTQSISFQQPCVVTGGTYRHEGTIPLMGPWTKVIQILPVTRQILEMNVGANGITPTFKLGDVLGSSNGMVLA